jgi:flagellar biosynthesis protein FlhA
MVMMVAAYMLRPLDFAAFPAVLLLTTLMRLSLNVASTRVVLLEGHTGPGAAGAVIEAFGHFLIGGNFAVGLIVFAILVVINFVVVTKGAERIAEVSARFALDAMPGKQMAVDADLNAGTDRREGSQAPPRRSGRRSGLLRLDGRCLQVRARRCGRRHPDPADQHLRRLRHRRAAARPERRQAADTYILLAVGDALVAQIPGPADLGGRRHGGVARGQGPRSGRQIVTADVHLAAVLGITATILGVLGVIPGMPHVVFLSSRPCWAMPPGCWRISPPAPPMRRSSARRPTAKPAGTTCSRSTSWAGAGLPADRAGGQEPPGRPAHPHQGRARKFAQEVGFLPPAVHVRDNLELKPSAYRITLRGVWWAKARPSRACSWPSTPAASPRR